MCGYNVWPTGRADYRPLLPPRIRLPSPHTAPSPHLGVDAAMMAPPHPASPQGGH